MTDKSFSPPDEFWIVRGIVTDPESYDEPCEQGDVEWRFYDSPPDQSPGSSADYLRLEQGIKENDGAVFHFVDEPPEDAELFRRWQDHVGASGSWSDLLDLIRDAAREQGILGPLLDGLDQIHPCRRKSR